MAKMPEHEAYEVIKSMRETAIHDTVTLQYRIADLKVDYRIDPHELTAAQIKRLEVRMAKRAREAEALDIAASKF